MGIQINEQLSYHIGFIGFGLIGGSIAKALKTAHPDYHITATSRSLAPLYNAQSEGVVDTVAAQADLHFTPCDFIFLCTPVEASVRYLSVLREIKKDTCVITDVGSVKGNIHKAAEAAGLSGCFIGGHPMAGSEQSGYASSDAALLKNSVYVITPTKNNTAQQIASYRALIADMGAVPLVMDFARHDYTVAGISHVPHLAAAALAKMVQENDDAEQNMHQLAAGGFKDTTRIAASSPEMWAQICTANRDAIGLLLNQYIAQLTEIRDHITGSNFSAEASCGQETPFSDTQLQSYISALFHAAGEYRNSFDN